jgi:hypothetical protein
MKRLILTLTACCTLITQSAIAAQIVPNTAIVSWTDTFFYNVNPKLPRGQKLKPIDRAYVREWQAIHHVVQNILVYKQVSCGRGTPEFVWTLGQPDGEPYPPRSKPPHPKSMSPDIHNLADAVFSTRHPNLMGRKIRPNETDFIRQWQTTRKQLSTVDPCY